MSSSEKTGPDFQEEGLGRLLELLDRVEDDDLKEVMTSVIVLENRHRSLDTSSSPVKDIQAILDRVAGQKDGEDLV